ncbi:YsnF/AvaK domain-containing protein [Bacillus sp. S3]|uniref:YsnF/AvaK domain-containing protein n=1 Tax=Bacillus sp. S3 TaxID=486398 RepID=UPI00118BE78D|nr:YsnF/AvaK domain-containing protein [Bacillus sp. S3]QCJ41864.1 YsnF/AvaK domain-containing protein [Bacillus sp. S3]
MSKKVLGVYNSSDDVIHAIEEFKNEGYSENELSIIANTRDIPSAIQNEIGVTTEEVSGTDYNRTYEHRGFIENLLSVFEINTNINDGTTSYFDHLVGLGFDEDAAREYERDINSGKILLLSDREAEQALGGGFTGTASPDQTKFDDNSFSRDKERTMKLREEQLDVAKERVQTGEVEVKKEVVEEQKTVHVPVTHEEVYVERQEVGGRTADTTTPIGSDETIHVPIVEEKVEVSKKPVVTEELVIGKRQVTETEQVTDNIKREEAKVETEGDAKVDESTIGRNHEDQYRK